MPVIDFVCSNFLCQYSLTVKGALDPRSCSMRKIYDGEEKKKMGKNGPLTTRGGQL